jgi:hypothetical protein
MGARHILYAAVSDSKRLVCPGVKAVNDLDISEKENLILSENAMGLFNIK